MSPDTPAPDRSPLPASLRAAFHGRLLATPEETADFVADYRRRWGGPALAVVQPDTAEDVAAVVRWCVAHDAVIVPQGGNTGLTGASVPRAEEKRPTVLLSLRRLQRVRAVDVAGGTMTVEAGCTLAAAQEAASAHGRLFPLSLASEGSCTVGGNLSTNAGGVQVLRYGNMRELCLGLEVVTARGEIWHGLNVLRKNNTGYDLRDLFIGAEGTLGIITAAVLKLYPMPVARVAALVRLQDPQAAVALLVQAQNRLAAGLTAFELVSGEGLALVLKHFPEMHPPFAAGSDGDSAGTGWHVLMEVSSLDSDAAAQAALEGVLAGALEADIIQDAVVSTSLAQFQALWALRERLSEAQSREGRNVKHDISVPVAQMPAFLRQARARLQADFPAVRLTVFGHLGDGNLHFNVAPRGTFAQRYDAAFAEDEARVNRIVHDVVMEHGGAISAEHGIGVLRQAELARYKQPLELQMMRAIKEALDPEDRMNPGKLLPSIAALQHQDIRQTGTETL